MSDELDPDEVPTIAGPGDQAGDRVDPQEFIGPYRLLKPLGEGGMGQVFAAEQKEPIRRKVALKAIKPGMDTKEVLARFEAERQAVALMDHTNIARVYDAGTTEDSRPYFAMELVEGKPLTEFCDEKKLPLKERLELFRQVCHAVQHAHQKGIIHRDLKPSNILITTDSGKADQPVPKIIDFGVAKALGPGLTEQTLFTMAGQIIGTPQYMSPEQAQFDASDIDTRSDIYSLGVLLYELLTGRTPVEMAELKKAGIDEMLRTIREEEAPKPSTKLHGLEENTQTSVAEVRQLLPSKLTQMLRGDLDWIVMKALEKERSRRYETANAFASDIQRYLSNEPVEASPPSTRYRLKKFAERNRAFLTAGGAVVAVLIAGIATTAWQAWQAKAEQVRAEIARADAEKLVEFMLNDLRTKLTEVGKLELMEGVDRAVTDFYGTYSDEDQSQHSEDLRARAWAAAADTHRKQGFREEAHSAYKEEEEIWRSLFANHPGEISYREALAQCLRKQAGLYRDKGDIINSSNLWYESHGLLREVSEESLSDLGLGELSTLLGTKALDDFFRKGASDQVEELAIKSLEIALRRYKEMPDSRYWLVKLAFAVGVCEQVKAQIEPLWIQYENPGSYFEMLHELIESAPNDYEGKSDLLVHLVRFLSVDEGFTEEKANAAIGLARELTEHDPQNTEWRYIAAVTESSAGHAYYHRKQLEVAKECYLNALGHWEMLIGNSGPSQVYRSRYASSLSWAGLVHSAIGERERAAVYQKRSVTIYEAIIKNDPKNTDDLCQMSLAYIRLAGLMEGREEEKLAKMKRGYEIALRAHKIAPEYDSTANTLHWAAKLLAGRHLRQKQYDLADKYIEISHKAGMHLTGDERGINYWDVLHMKGQILAGRGNLNGAVEMFQLEMAGYRDVLNEFSWERNSNDAGQFIHKSVKALQSVVDNSTPLNEDITTYVEGEIGFLEGKFPLINAEFDQVHVVIRSLSNLWGQTGNARFEEGDLAKFSECADQSVRMILQLLPKVAPSREHEVLSLLARSIENREMKFRAQSEGGSILRKETGMRILEYAENQEHPFTRNQECKDANLIPWLACRSLFYNSLKESDKQSASHWLDRGEQFLKEAWRRDPNDSEWRDPLPVAMKHLGKIRNDLQDHGGAERAYRQAFAWWERLSDAEGGDQSDALGQLGSSAGELVRLMGEWKLGDAERVPVMKIQVEARLAAWGGGDVSQLPHLINALVVLGQAEQRLGEIEAAESRFKRVQETVASAGAVALAKLKPPEKGNIALAAENLGELYYKEEIWGEAEMALRQSLEYWQMERVNYRGAIDGNLMATRVKIRLANLYGASGRNDAPERQQWYEEAYWLLHPLAEKNEVPGTLDWVYKTACNKLRRDSVTKGALDE